jgi:RimJ/RimL family protein N-acetyltransferase
MHFDLQPTLMGTLLELKPLQAADFDDLYAVAADPLLWEQHPERDRYRPEVFEKFFRQALDSGGALVARDRRNGQVIGSSRFYGYDEGRSEIEIGWSFLARPYWGGRYNGEMKHLMLRHAFRFVKSVVFLVDRDNLRSQRALEKIGAVRTGTTLGPMTRREAVVYRVTADAFATQLAR